MSHQETRKPGQNAKTTRRRRLGFASMLLTIRNWPGQAKGAPKQMCQVPPRFRPSLALPDTIHSEALIGGKPWAMSR